MADDRLDDAIDAVVRAVDRIERATRAPAPEGAPPVSSSAPLADATRPIQGAVGSTVHRASPEVHELVGRIVGRMQSLEDHLAAASQLRAEVSELVARLAAATSTSR